MYDIEGSLDRQILENRQNRPTVVFTEALDPRALEAACFLTRFVRPVFLATEDQVREVLHRELGHLDANRVEFTLSEAAFVDISARSDLVEEFARECVEYHRQRGEKTSLKQATQEVSEPAHFGIWTVRQEHADMVVGGATHDPKDYFRPMLDILGRRSVITEAGVFILPDDHPHELFPHNIVVFGDVGVNSTMTPEVLAEIAVGTCAVARDLIPEEMLPQINGAIVSYSNRGSDEGPSPELIRQAMKLIPSVLEDRITQGARYASIHIEGEVKVSAALSPRSAGYFSHGEKKPWAGTNVIICPNLDMGNMLYHLYAVRFPDAKKFSVIFGMGFRGVDLSMDCTPEDIRLTVKSSVLRLHRFGVWEYTPKDTFFHRFRTLAINPGSTSTKIGYYVGDLEVFTTEIQHSAEELKPFEGRGITEQFAFRKETIVKALDAHGVSVDQLEAVSARGGALRPIPHGTYRINEAMLDDSRKGIGGEHASNLGALIAHELAVGKSIPAFIVDPIVVDEAPMRVRITGIKEIPRKIISHALNQFASARRYAEENETFYERLNLVVVHMGGGISVGAHHKGRYADVNNALDGEGPFTPQRSGSLPTGQLIDLCFSGKYTLAELKKLNKGRGGLVSLLGTGDLREVEKRIEANDLEAAQVFEAMAYQIAKEITSLLPAFDGEGLDQIILTGGMARSQRLVAALTQLTSAVGCGVTIYPGENEIFALIKGALRVLSGKEKAKEYVVNR